MRRTWQGKALAVGMVVAAAVRLNAAEATVALSVREPAGVARENEWTTFGVPFAQGALRDTALLRARAGDTVLPVAQFKAQNRWPDGTVKWALCTLPLSVPAEGETDLALEQGAGPEPQAGIAVEEAEDHIVVDTGVLRARIGKQAFRMLDDVILDGRRVLRQSDDAGAVLTLPDGLTLNMAAHPPESVEIVEAGPARALILARGRFPGAYVLDGQEMVRWSCQLYFHANSDIVRIHYTLGNDGAFGSHMPRREYFRFSALHLHFDLALGAGLTAVADEAEARPTADRAFVLRQRSAASGRPPVFQAMLGDEEQVSSDARSPGWLGLTGTGGAASVAIRDFWQNYPKEIAARHGRLSLALWPEWGGYPEGQDIYNLCGGKQKTHEILLRFGAGDRTAAQRLAATLNRPLLPLAAPEHYADSGAIVLFSPADTKTGDAELDELIRRYDDLQRSKPAGISQAAEAGRHGNYFNWMNWGDLYWACGSASLHYDWTHIMLVHGLRTGQRDFFDWASAMARHQYDIDIHRSPRDRPAFRFLSAYEKEQNRGGTGWHVSTNPGSMLPIPSHNWIQGQALHAVLTGDPESWTVARINAEGVRSRMFGVHKVREKPRRDQPRTYGWSIECLVALYALTGEQAYLDDSRTLFENGLWHMFVQDGKSVLKWGNVQAAYCVRPLIDYHWRSGDERALELLAALADQTDEWKERFEYFMFGDAAAYVYLQTGNEDYLAKARMLLADLLNKRGQFNPRSGAWTKSEAKTSRSSYKHIAIERLKALGRAPVGK